MERRGDVGNADVERHVAVVAFGRLADTAVDAALVVHGCVIGNAGPARRAMLLPAECIGIELAQHRGVLGHALEVDDRISHRYSCTSPTIWPCGSVNVAICPPVGIGYGPSSAVA